MRLNSLFSIRSIFNVCLLAEAAWLLLQDFLLFYRRFHDSFNFNYTKSLCLLARQKHLFFELIVGQLKDVRETATKSKKELTKMQKDYKQLMKYSKQWGRLAESQGNFVLLIRYLA